MTSWLAEAVGETSGFESAGRDWEPYPAYKDSGIEWLGPVPREWNVRRLKYAASFATTRTAGGADCTYVALEHLESETGRIIGSLTTDAVETTPVIFEAGDVLFGKLRPYLAKVAAPRFSGCCSSELVVLRPSRNVSQRFLFYQLISTGFIRWINSLTYGAKMPRVSIDKLADTQIAVPSIDTQRDITSFLDWETSRIDDLIAKKQHLIRLLEEKGTALITRAVTKGLDPDVPMKDSGVEWLGEIPEHWQVPELRYLCDSQRPIMYGIVLPGPSVEDGVPIIKGGDVAEGTLKPDELARTSIEIDEVHARSRVHSGDVLYSIRGSFGDVAVVPPELEGANLTQDVARISPRPGISHAWLRFVLQSRPVKAHISAGALGAAVRGVNIRDLQRVRVPLPPASERKAIAQMLNSRESRYRAIQSAIRRARRCLEDYRAALITAAVTGKIDLREHAA